MFADRAKIYIRSGKGGDGHVSFRRELYVPVSYTHLDVYKRQDHRLSENVSTGRSGKSTSL